MLTGSLITTEDMCDIPYMYYPVKYGYVSKYIPTAIKWMCFYVCVVFFFLQAIVLNSFSA